jgi:hypothetical protein
MLDIVHAEVEEEIPLEVLAAMQNIYALIHTYLPVGTY